MARRCALLRNAFGPGSGFRPRVAIVTAVLLLVAPVASALCEAACSRADASTPGEAHRCCHDTVPTQGPAVGALAAACDHPSGSASNTNLQQSFGGADRAASVSFLDSDAMDAALDGATCVAGPPNSRPFRSQLRI